MLVKPNKISRLSSQEYHKCHQWKHQENLTEREKKRNMKNILLFSTLQSLLSGLSEGK